ncbi:MAG: hypothetical protein Q8O88_02365 [bacterium]|nr:hypothetical protein [bacterium]
MGLFSSPSDKYSQKLHYFPEIDFRNLFRNLQVKSLTQQEEDMVHLELEKHRSRKGKLSLRDIYNVIHSFRNQKKISINDEKILMDSFINYFSKFNK